MGENENEVEKEPDQEKVEEVDKNPETDTSKFLNFLHIKPVQL